MLSHAMDINAPADAASALMNTQIGFLKFMILSTISFDPRTTRYVELALDHAKSTNADVVIIDTHLFIRTEHGYYPGIPLKLLTIINPSHLILITAKSEEIHKRRTDDNSRQRDLISIDRISDDLRLSESMISSSSIISGCPFYIIQNNTDEIEKATDDICKVILSK